LLSGPVTVSFHFTLPDRFQPFSIDPPPPDASLFLIFRPVSYGPIDTVLLVLKSPPDPPLLLPFIARLFHLLVLLLPLWNLPLFLLYLKLPEVHIFFHISEPGRWCFEEVPLLVNPPVLIARVFSCSTPFIYPRSTPKMIRPREQIPSLPLWLILIFFQCYAFPFLSYFFRIVLDSGIPYRSLFSADESAFLPCCPSFG